MFENFFRDDTGAITTDWVAMTSALIIVAMIVVFSLFSEGITPLTGSINAQIDSGSEVICAPIEASVTDGSTECDMLSN